MLFKTSRELSDWRDLYSRNSRLATLLYLLDNFSLLELGNKQITLTSIHRTDEENKAANAATDIHVMWRAADVSIKEFSSEERVRLVAFCNQFKYPGTPGHQVALIHSVLGGAEHLHIQYWG